MKQEGKEDEKEEKEERGEGEKIRCGRKRSSHSHLDSEVLGVRRSH